MGKITREEYDKYIFQEATSNLRGAAHKALWSRIQEAQSSEPMSVDQIEPVLRKAFQDKFGPSQPTTDWMDLLHKMAKAVAPLTVQQGFVPDWSKAEAGHVGIVLYFTEWPEITYGHAHGLAGYIRRPAPRMRQKTRDEKVHDLYKPYGAQDWSIGMTDALAESTIDDLCRAAGIPLEVPE